MTLPLWFPEPQTVEEINGFGSITLEELCKLAETRCRASGQWVRRPVALRILAAGEEPWIRVETGPWRAVEIGVPPLDGQQVTQARWALGALAYSPVSDLVARASCRNQDWARIDPELPPQRPRLTEQAQAFVREVADVCKRHGLCLDTLDQSDLQVVPLSEEALAGIQHARPLDGRLVKRDPKSRRP